MTEERELTVFVIDDDAAIRDSLSLLLGLKGYRTAVFACAEDFLAALDPHWVGCVVVDVKMPGMSGLELQAELATRDCRLPVVIITAHGSVAAARTAFKIDAVDFLEKPFEDEQLIGAIDSAFMRERTRMAEQEETAKREAVVTRLTERERQVMDLVVVGKHNRKIAEELGISPRTVEVHKARIMSKLGARELSDLIRLVRPSK